MVEGVPPKLGPTLRRLRTEKGFTQRSLIDQAAELGGKLSGGHIAEIERGRRGISRDKASTIATTLGLSDDEAAEFFAAAGITDAPDGATAGTVSRLAALEARLDRIEKAVERLARRRRGER